MRSSKPPRSFGPQILARPSVAAVWSSSCALACDLLLLIPLWQRRDCAGSLCDEPHAIRLVSCIDGPASHLAQVFACVRHICCSARVLSLQGELASQLLLDSQDECSHSKQNRLGSLSVASLHGLRRKRGTARNVHHRLHEGQSLMASPRGGKQLAQRRRHPHARSAAAR